MAAKDVRFSQDARSRMLYDARHVFVNGESWRAGGRDATLMRRLADRRILASAEVADVIREWDGMGYNRRAVNLHRCAAAVAPRSARTHSTLPPPARTHDALVCALSPAAQDRHDDRQRNHRLYQGRFDISSVDQPSIAVPSFTAEITCSRICWYDHSAGSSSSARSIAGMASSGRPPCSNALARLPWAGALSGQSSTLLRAAAMASSTRSSDDSAQVSSNHASSSSGQSSVTLRNADSATFQRPAILAAVP